MLITLSAASQTPETPEKLYFVAAQSLTLKKSGTVSLAVGEIVELTDGSDGFRAILGRVDFVEGVLTTSLEVAKAQAARFKAWGG